MTRMDTPKSDGNLHLKYMMGVLYLKVVNKRRKKTEEKSRYYARLEPASFDVQYISVSTTPSRANCRDRFILTYFTRH